MGQVAGSLKLELAQYREVAAFSQFGSDLDAATQALLNRGYRLTELLKQKQYAPMPAEDQVCSLYSGTRGFLDKLDVNDIAQFETDFLNHLKSKYPHVLEELKETRVLSDEVDQELNQILTDFVPQYTQESG